MDPSTVRNKVVPIRRAAPAPSPNAAVITQERLAQAAGLIAAKAKVIAELQNCLLELSKDLAEGAEVERGDLIFDRDLMIVRRRRQDQATLLPYTPSQTKN